MRVSLKDGHDQLVAAARCGRMFEVLKSIAKDLWKAIDAYGQPLVCVACSFPNQNIDALKLLLNSGFDSNPVSHICWLPPIIVCLIRNNVQALEILLAVGAKTHNKGISVINHCFGPDYECAKILLANGVPYNHLKPIPALVAFQRSVHQCRSATIAFLRVKRKANLWKWDKFLLREIALAVWATRMNF